MLVPHYYLPSISPGSVNTLNFRMIPSPGLPVGLQNAGAYIIVHTQGPVEVMEVYVAGLPPNTDFDFFVIQKPNAPFGLSWYQNDIETDANGQGFALFTGRFNVETFLVSPGTVPAPVVFNSTFPDSNTRTTVGPLPNKNSRPAFSSIPSMTEGEPDSLQPRLFACSC